MISYGALLAIFTVTLWALGNCLLALSIRFLEVHPVACIMQVYIWAGVSLLLLSTFGKGGKQVSMRETLRSPITWLYGASELGVGLFLMLTLIYTSPAEASFLGRLSVPFAMLAGLLFLKKRASRLDWQCFFPMLIGTAIVLAGVDSPYIGYIMIYISLEAIAVVLRGLAVEYHPVFAKTTNIYERCRVTGTIVLFSGVMVCTTLLALAWFKEGSEILRTAFPHLPSMAEMTHMPTVIFAIFHGFFIIALTRYLYFRSVSLISNTTFLMFAAMTPFTTYFLQELLNLVGLLGEIPPLNSYMIVGGIVLTLTSLWAAFAREMTTAEDALNKTIDDVTSAQEERIAEEQKFIDALNTEEPRSK